MRGRIAPGAAVYTGTGVVKSDEASLTAALRANALEYGVQFKVVTLMYRVSSKLRRGPAPTQVAIELQLELSSPEA